MITNIDVTLRDGGYRNAFAFTQRYAEAHARLSVAVGVDWIEIGYRGGSFNAAGSAGLTGRCENTYIESIVEAVGAEHVGIMVHPHNVSDKDLQEAFAAGARLLRVCLGADPDPGMAVAERAASIGYTSCVNVTRLSTVRSDRITSLARAAANAGASAIYLADSNGSLVPAAIAESVQAASAGGIAVGIHTHNHLGLALANAISATDAGCTWVDSAVLGMGKGAGNLVTEQWIAYLSQTKSQPEAFDLAKLMELSALLAVEVRESAPRLDFLDILMGLFDLSVEHADTLKRSSDHGDRVRTARRIAGIDA